MEAPDQLIAAASQARDNAYAPYSKFRVGAAVRAGSGHIYTGANIENASYGLTICAERAAVFAAASAGERELKEIAIVTENASPPCGACRQVLSEFGGEDLSIVLSDVSGSTQGHSLGDFLPESFSARHLPHE